MRGIQTPIGFTELYQREYGQLVRTAGLITNDWDGAPEVVQEAFARLLANWDRISQYERPGAWLHTVTVRLALRRRRHRAREAPLQQRARHESGASDNSSSVSQRLDVHAALGRLTPRTRAVMILFYLDDMSVADIATVLGSRVGTVRVQLHKGRTRLEELLADSNRPADPANAPETRTTATRRTIHQEVLDGH